MDKWPKAVGRAYERSAEGRDYGWLAEGRIHGR